MPDAVLYRGLVTAFSPGFCGGKSMKPPSELGGGRGASGLNTWGVARMMRLFEIEIYRKLPQMLPQTVYRQG